MLFYTIINSDFYWFGFVTELRSLDGKNDGGQGSENTERGSEQRGNDNAACIYTFLKVKGKTFFYKTMIIL